MKNWVLCSLLCLSMVTASAQQYIVFFNHKAPNAYSLSDPAAYLSQRALERRQSHNIPLDSTDLPVPTSYLQSLGQISGVQVLNVSKWLNAASVQVSSAEALQQIEQLPFVQQQQRVASSTAPNRNIFKRQLGGLNKKKPQSTEEHSYNYGLAAGQVQLHKGQFLHNIGLRGEGVYMGVLDAGFYQYTTLPAFDSVRAAGRILDTWDFVARETSVAEDNAHGMQCFSIIAGNIPGQFVGTAPNASFFLYRSENTASETLVEEFNWVCAAERVDSAGGSMISSSLGYNQFDNGVGNHTYQDMNGNTTIAARGADLAAKKGILVVNAAGNEGNNRWKYIMTPADGDSVLAVGAVDRNGVPGSFSSYGPSADGRVKPDVASVGVGTYVQGTNGRIASGNGTSFATPNMAGLAACLWQGFPKASNMMIIGALRQAGSQAQAPDNRVGYGIPDMRKAVGILLKRETTALVEAQGCKTTLSWQSKDMAAMRYEIERMRTGENTFTKIGEQAGTGAVWGNRSYQFTDNLSGTGPGTITYRILQVLDTTAAAPYAVYLDTVAINIFPSCALTSRFSIMPNPVPAQAMLQANFEEAVQSLNLVIRNGVGQQMQVLRLTKAAGIQNIPINTAAFAAGKYYLQVYNGDKLLTTLEFLKL